MSVRIRAHYDGKTLVPEEPLDLPVNTRVSAELEIIDGGETERRRKEALQAWEAFKANPIKGLSISDESLRRENLYEERP